MADPMGLPLAETKVVSMVERKVEWMVEWMVD